MSGSFCFDAVLTRRGTRSVKWDEAAADVLPLWVADMDFATAPCVQQAVMQRAAHPCYGYTLVPEAYYEAIIRWFGERHGWRIRREEILYTIGVVPAIAAILRAVCQIGDHVVMLSPVYNCFYSCIRNAGATASLSSLVVTTDADGFMHYDIDWADLEARLSHERATVMLLCNPHNPVGRIWTADELRRLAALCCQYHVLLLSDEIHCELTRPGISYVPLGAIVESNVECVKCNVECGVGKGLLYAVCTSPSKAFNIAGLQNANIIVPDAELRRRIDRAINLNETCDVNPFGVEAVMAAYGQGAAWLDALRQYIWDNYDFACQWLRRETSTLGVRRETSALGVRREASTLGVRIADMQATYLMWVDYSAICPLPSNEVRQRLMDEARVWFCDGLAYGVEGQHCLRINLATSRTILTQALTQFVAWIKTNS